MLHVAFQSHRLSMHSCMDPSLQLQLLWPRVKHNEFTAASQATCQPDRSEETFLLKAQVSSSAVRELKPLQTTGRAVEIACDAVKLWAAVKTRNIQPNLCHGLSSSNWSWSCKHIQVVTIADKRTCITWCIFFTRMSKDFISQASFLVRSFTWCAPGTGTKAQLREFWRQQREDLVTKSAR